MVDRGRVCSRQQASPESCKRRETTRKRLPRWGRSDLWHLAITRAEALLAEVEGLAPGPKVPIYKLSRFFFFSFFMTVAQDLTESHQPCVTRSASSPLHVIILSLYVQKRRRRKKPKGDQHGPRSSRSPLKTIQPTRAVFEQAALALLRGRRAVTRTEV